MNRLQRRLETIIYQLLKDYPEAQNLSSEQRVKMVISIFDALIDEGVTFSDVTALVDTALGANLEWTENSTIIRVQHANITVEDDLADIFIEKVVEAITQMYLNDSPWLVEGYGDDVFLEVTRTGLENYNPSSFVTRWKTDATGFVLTGDSQIRLPLHSSGHYNFTVDWGDGLQNTILTYDQDEVTHTYGAPGEYEVIITGRCEGFGFEFGSCDASKLIDVKQWGTARLHNHGAQFRGCTNLQHFTALDTPNLSGITNFDHMFDSASQFNGDLSDWTFDTAVSMKYMFRSATQFNQPLPWQTGTVRRMEGMFFNAASFNQNISSWCVARVDALPPQFATGSSLDVANYPQWGACP